MAAVTLVMAASIIGCAGSHAESPMWTSKARAASLGEAFVGAPKSLIATCHETASAVGYRVPCPTRVSAGLTETGSNGLGGCELHIIGSGGVGGCATSWRGWVVGSSTTPDEHLVIVGSPRPLRKPARLVNGPAWYPGARVVPLARITVHGWRMRAVYVPRGTNEGSAFADHVVLIWTVGTHTYGIGFHDVSSIRQTLGLDKELAENVQLVGP